MSNSNYTLKSKLENLTNDYQLLSSEKETISFKLKLTEESKFRIESENIKLQETLSKNNAQIFELQQKNIQTQLLSKSSEFLQIENLHLQNDNKKLFEMLKSTSEYNKFAFFTDDKHALRSVKDSLAISKEKRNTFSSNNRSEQLKKAVNFNLKENPDLFYWAPEKCFQFLRELNKNHEVQIPEKVLEFIILELNNIWRKRELFVIDHASNFCKNCKRGIQGFFDKNMKLPFSDDLKLQTIKKLEDQLAVTKSRLSSAQKISQKKDLGIFNWTGNQFLANNLKQAKLKSNF